jgi:hypothetical protein
MAVDCESLLIFLGNHKKKIKRDLFNRREMCVRFAIFAVCTENFSNRCEIFRLSLLFFVLVLQYLFLLSWACGKICRAAIRRKELLLIF